MKHIAYLTAASLILGLAQPALANDLEALSTTELLEKARAEGSVSVYSFTSRVARVEKAFEAAYPGIDFQGYDISSTEQIARLKAEAGAGIANADVVFISDAPVVLNELVVSSILENYVPPRIADKLSPQSKTPLLSQRLSTKVLMYNEEANPQGSPIKNLWQLTTSEWRGRVVMVDPLQRGDYLDLVTEFVLRSNDLAKAYQEQFGKPIALGDANDAGHKFIADLFANDLILVKSTDDVNAAVGKLGQKNPPVGFTSYSDRRDNKDKGWALQVSNDTRPSSGILFPVVLAVAKGAKHPAAARLAIDFFMGDDSKTGGEGYKPFYVLGDYATRTDITPHPDAVALDKLTAWHIDPAATAKVRKDVGDFILTLQ